MMTRMLTIVLLAALAGCKSDERGAKGVNETPSAAGTKMDSPECKDYKAVVEKAIACDKTSKQERDTMKQEFDLQAAEWSKGPADPQGVIARACANSAKMIRMSADPSCGL